MAPGRNRKRRERLYAAKSSSHTTTPYSEEENNQTVTADYTISSAGENTALEETALSPGGEVVSCVRVNMSLLFTHVDTGDHPAT